jgi:pimeloyl-ACP methyl ester carboxylesterase
MHEGALMSDTTPSEAEFDADADAMAEEPESELIPAGPFETVRSADGTLIAFERAGSGPALILIGGAFSVRQGGYGLRDILSDRFTVYSVDRRGRGDSTDTQPYSVEREIEDLAALVGVAGDDGGPVYVYGHSSGGILSLEAAARGLPIERLAVYEPPFTYDPADPTQSEPEGRAVLAALDGGASAVWAGRASDAVVAAVPDARRYTVGEEAHGAAADVLAPVLAEFFLGA